MIPPRADSLQLIGPNSSGSPSGNSTAPPPRPSPPVRLRADPDLTTATWPQGCWPGPRNRANTTSVSDRYWGPMNSRLACRGAQQFTAIGSIRVEQTAPLPGNQTVLLGRRRSHLGGKSPRNVMRQIRYVGRWGKLRHPSCGHDRKAGGLMDHGSVTCRRRRCPGSQLTPLRGGIAASAVAATARLSARAQNGNPGLRGRRPPRSPPI
jgi:hypothetical protein